MAELIASGDTLDTGRQAINSWYSGTTNIWSAGTGTNSIKTVAGNNTAASSFSLTAGLSNSNSGPYGVITNGSGNTINGSGTLSFIGNGTSNNITNSRAFIGTGKNQTASQQYSFIGNGGYNIASGVRGTILNGRTNTASALYSLVVNGKNNTASQTRSTVLNGHFNTASGIQGAVLGGLSNTASGLYSSVINGNSNVSSGQYSLTHGYDNTASFIHSAAIGKAATAGAAYQMVFAAGAGNTIRLRYSDGTGSFEGGTNTGPADYAEYFEWADNNPNNDKRYGYAVSLVENGKIQIGGNNIIGIVSAAPAIVGDSSELSWKEKYEKDEWDLIQYESFETFYSEELEKRIYKDSENVLYSKLPRKNSEKTQNKLLQNILIKENTTFETIKVPKLNPNYNPDEKYVPRSERPEWTPVGLLGKLRIKTAEKITGNFIDINNNGIAKNGTKYQVLKKIKEFDGNYGIVLIFFK